MYLITQKPYVKGIISFYVIANELLTFTFYFVLGLRLINQETISLKKASDIGIYVILAAALLNVICSLIDMVRTVVSWWRNRKSNKIHNEQVVEEETKSAENNKAKDAKLMKMFDE